MKYEYLIGLLMHTYTLTHTYTHSNNGMTHNEQKKKQVKCVSVAEQFYLKMHGMKLIS